MIHVPSPSPEPTHRGSSSRSAISMLRDCMTFAPRKVISRHSSQEIRPILAAP